MNIYVGNLSYEASEENLRQAFEAFGQVSAASIVKDKYSGQPRGFGFVEMPDQAEAQVAIQNLNGKELLGRPMNVNEARSRNDRGRAGGPAGHQGRSGYRGSRSRY
ncbi:MAG: RNA recognition motif domain-containing protein [Thermodesulfobacteriota bacterium]